MQKLTKEQAVVISGYTGISCGAFSDLHEAIERKLGRPVWTHELASPKIWEKIKAAFKDEFLALAPDDAVASQQT